LPHDPAAFADAAKARAEGVSRRPLNQAALASVAKDGLNDVMKFARFLVLIGLVAAGAVRAEVRLPALFQDQMVLQRDQPLPVWGWAKPGERVTVSIGKNNAAAAKADATGKWRLALKPIRATREPMQLLVSGENKITIQDVLVGEVWLCSGQSNMERQLGLRPPQQPLLNWQEDVARAKFPALRMFTVKKTAADEPKTDCEGQWVVCSPETVTNFSAVGYYFAAKLHEDLGVPIGMIHSSWGGTLAEAWTRLEAVESNPAFKSIVERRATSNTGGPNRAAVLYNGMIAPLIPYRIRGAIWYQGESNVPRAWQYRMLFPTMIGNWRKDWRQGNFPFYYVQIAPFRYGKQDPRNCAELWESQLQTLSLPKTGMAVTVDIGDVKDIHPANKKEVGRRLALWALAKDYGRNITYSGPLYRKMKLEDHAVRVYFNHARSGLSTRDGQSPSHFQVAGAGRDFVDARAEIDGDTVIVWAESVGHPVAVRYAWRDDAEPNLINKEGLPASPFRTDSWPAVTVGEN
jgi:sialate O-acetylesterase